MTFGFHVPVHFSETEIEDICAPALDSGSYRQVEVKYPFDVRGSDPEPYDRAVRKLLRQARPAVSIHVPTNYDLGSWSDEVRAATLRQVSRVIEYAADLGATVAAVHPGTIHMMDLPPAADTPARAAVHDAAARRKERARALTVEALRELAPVAQRAGISIAVENLLLPQEIAHSAEELRRIVDEVDQPSVGALFDAGHAHRCGLECGPFVRALGSRVRHVHLNDNDGSCDLHLAPGQGTVPFVPIFRVLAEAGFNGAVVAETIYHSAAELEQTAAAFRTYLGEASR